MDSKDSQVRVEGQKEETGGGGSKVGLVEGERQPAGEEGEGIFNQRGWTQTWRDVTVADGGPEAPGSER